MEEYSQEYVSCLLWYTCKCGTVASTFIFWVAIWYTLWQTLSSINLCFKYKDIFIYPMPSILSDSWPHMLDKYMTYVEFQDAKWDKLNYRYKTSMVSQPED